jgi:hypothetical protein
MKKRYLLFLCLFLAQTAAHTQCLVNGIFTRLDAPINNQNPSMLNNFNWMATLYPQNSQASGPGNDLIYSPIYQPDNIIIDNLRVALDMKPDDGWELLRRQFGYLQNGSLANPKPEQLYLVMYNKYTSILRIFYARGGTERPAFTSARVTLQFAQFSQYQTSLLDLTEGGIPIDKLFAKDKFFQSPSPFNNSLYQWFYVDFPMQYDPCTCYYSSRLFASVDFITSSTIELQGSATGSLTAQNTTPAQLAQPENKLSFKDLQGGAQKAVKTYKSIAKFKDDQNAAIKKFLAPNLIEGSQKPAGLTKLQEGMMRSDFLRQGLKALPYLGAAVSLLDFFIGGGKQAAPTGPQQVELTPMALDMTMTLNGSMTTTARYGDITFQNPGSQQGNNPAEDYPYYNEIMGVFNLLYTPEVNHIFSRERLGSTRSGLYWKTDIDYRFENPIKYVLNPAARLTIDEAQAAIIVQGDSLGLYGPAGEAWELEAKDQKTGLWQYRSQYVDVNCLQNKVFRIRANSAPGNINWLPRGPLFVKLLINLKRQVNPTTSQNVLLVVKYPLNPKAVTAFTTPNPAACNNIFLQASAAEIDGMCIDEVYKTNRRQTIKQTIDWAKQSVTVGKPMLYPNPANNNASLLLNLANDGSTDIFVTDLTGKRLLNIFKGNANKGFRTFTINTAGLAVGQYFVVTAQGASRVVSKLQVLR